MDRDGTSPRDATLYTPMLVDSFTNIMTNATVVQLNIARGTVRMTFNDQSTSSRTVSQMLDIILL